ncbi:hypothetical protein MASR1M36_17480 [Candidatus Cloacimonadaceae bacterium]
MEVRRSDGINITGGNEEDESTQEHIEYLDKETLRNIGIIKEGGHETGKTDNYSQCSQDRPCHRISLKT